MNSGFVGPHHMVKKTVQVVLHQLHPHLPVGVPDQLAELTAMEGPSQCHPGSLDCALQDAESTFAQHFHKLGYRGLIILLHPLVYRIQHFADELESPTTPC